MPATEIDFPDPHDASAPRLQVRFDGEPLRVWQAHRPDEVHAVLQAVEDAARAGRWCVGGLAYEAAVAFDPAFCTHAPEAGLPLAWFAEYAAPLDGACAVRRGTGDAEPAHIHWHAGAHDEQARGAFEHALARIHAAIAAGECYQINYTAPLHGRLFGSRETLFEALKSAQPDGYVASMSWDGEQILSLSPELFFDWDGDALLTRPMKGTAPRGASPEEDSARADHLRTSPKERAENVMIVDLLRNDVSRIAMPHSVKVPRLFHVQALPTVWQMTSDVVARTREHTRLVDVFAALFPCGSVTGAPKVQAMRLIAELEGRARGVYCGALGVVRPGRTQGSLRATFNVPIRTLALRGAQVRCGIGSGITSSANAADEWQEWRHKRAFIERALVSPLQLLETLALHDGQFRNLDRHLARMRASAAHFEIDWPERHIAQTLNTVRGEHAEGEWRVRLLLGEEDGVFSAQTFAFGATTQPVALALARRAFMAAHSDFVRHKTTRRSHYAAFEPAAGSGLFDVILWNEAGEITECTRGNIAMQLDEDGSWITPPLACGLLPGVGRAIALESGRVREQALHVRDIGKVRAWAFVNSLRGWLDARVS
ncbi:chorismate-binding protein [Diaphorobacter aerolatus]|uniref:Chorismate-binding protein n=1 Tax=Diaphorobacter aerolatus TaxID=1288495 RepID=A0A7H0GHU6_9BURK|nr:chorismate-binding protein [Diaphorobacter aerolatus]QNP47862.1 chorismate-binding protein [Diaphorobacter aerolatus]